MRILGLNINYGMGSLSGLSDPDKLLLIQDFNRIAVDPEKALVPEDFYYPDHIFFRHGSQIGNILPADGNDERITAVDLIQQENKCIRYAAMHLLLGEVDELLEICDGNLICPFQKVAGENRVVLDQFLNDLGIHQACGGFFNCSNRKMMPVINKHSGAADHLYRLGKR